MSIKRDIEYAIYIHGAWKARFRNFLSGRVAMNISSVGCTDACKLGHWLDNEARRMLAPDDHAEASRLHARFHAVCGSIVDSIKRRDFVAARTALLTDGSFDEASRELAAFLHRMPLRQRAVGKAAAAAAEGEALQQAA